MDRRNTLAIYSSIFVVLCFFQPLAGKSWIGEKTSMERGLFLKPDDAFRFDFRVSNDNELLLHWKISDGYYLYKSKFEIKAAENSKRKAALILPQGNYASDEYFGDVEIYRDRVSLKIDVGSLDISSSGTVLVIYQGCADAGLCYPPIKKFIPLSTPGVSRYVPEEITSEKPIFKLVFSFMGFGLLLAFTPCVLPMAPILSGILIRGSRSTKKNVQISFIYVLSMSGVYSILGLCLALIGRNVQYFLQHPLTTLGLALLFLLMSLAMLGLFSISLPSSMTNKLSGFSRKLNTDSYLNIATMGAVSALIVTPCITPPLAAVLTFVTDSGSPLLGGVALFSMGFGMGIPLIILGTSLGYLVPRAGNWMTYISLIVGLLLFTMAFYYLDRVLSDYLMKFIWLAYCLSVCLIVLIKTKILTISHVRKIVLVTFLATLSIGFIRHFYPDSLGLLNSESRDESSLKGWEDISTLNKINEKISQNIEEKTPLIIEFYADWCIECKRLENNILSRGDVQQALSSYSLYKVDITKMTREHQNILKFYDLFGPPALVIYSVSGQKEYQTLIGLIDSQELIIALQGGKISGGG